MRYAPFLYYVSNFAHVGILASTNLFTFFPIFAYMRYIKTITDTPVRILCSTTPGAFSNAIGDIHISAKANTDVNIYYENIEDATDKVYILYLKRVNQNDYLNLGSAVFKQIGGYRLYLSADTGCEFDFYCKVY